MSDGVTPETNHTTVEGGGVDYSQKLNEISSKINELNDGTVDNDNQAKDELKSILTSEFINNLTSYLESHQEDLVALQDSLITLLNSYGDKTDQTYSSLKQLANKIGLKESNGTWVKESQEDSDNIPEKPTISFKGELNGIKAGAEQDKKTGNDGLFSDLTREEPAEGTNIDDDKNLYKTMKVVSEQLSKIGSLLSDANLENDADLVKVKDGLNIVQTVVDYPTPDNVKILQKFISENLEGQDKTDFDRASKRGNDFDGKFGKGTLKGVNIILKKTDDYITKMEDYLKALNNKENQGKLDQVAPKSNLALKKGENIDAESLLDNVPAGADVSFLDDNEKAKLDESGEQKIKIKVELDGKTKIVEVTVNVSDNADQPDTPPTSTTPLTMKEGDSERTYQVVENSSTIAENANVPGATFYLATDYEPNQPGEGEDRECQPVPEGTNDYPCIMKLGDNLYKVDICNGYLCPLATKLVKKSNGAYEEDKGGVLFMNNPSCIKYLEQKMPNIANDYEIGWNSRYNDYYLKSYGRALTIEPMTMAGGWISKKEKDNPGYLSKNLAFLNLTNYIRWEGDEHNRPDPDVNRKVNKFKRIKDGKNKLGIDRNQFGLGTATEQELARFKKYNNGEQWEDDWDKKRKNKVYQKIIIR